MLFPCCICCVATSTFLTRIYAVPSPKEGEVKNIGISIFYLPSEVVALKSEVIVGKVAPPPPLPLPPGWFCL